MPLSCLVLVSISRVFSWELPSCHPFPTHFNSLDCCLPLPAFLLHWTQNWPPWLEWVFYLWGLCHRRHARYPCQEKEVAQAISGYFFFQCLGSAHLSNPRYLASSIQWRLAPCRTKIMILLATATASAGQVSTKLTSNPQPPVKLTRTLNIVPITLFSSYGKLEVKKVIATEKILPTRILLHPASLLAHHLPSQVSSSFTPLKQLFSIPIIMGYELAKVLRLI